MAEQKPDPNPYEDAYRAYVQAVKDYWANVDVDAVVAQAGAQAIARAATAGMGMAPAGGSVPSTGIGTASAGPRLVALGAASAPTSGCGGHGGCNCSNTTATLGSWGTFGTVGGCYFSVGYLGTFGCIIC
jgi:hypothetical protein